MVPKWTSLAATAKAGLAGMILVQVMVLPSARAADGIEPAPPRKQFAPLPKRTPLVKLIRPGVSGVAGMPPAGGCLIAESFSREANASGVETTGMTGFYECRVAKHIAFWAAPTHFLLTRGTSGFGDIAFGPIVTLNHETPLVPLFALGYGFKQPAATHQLGSGLNDHKVTVYADKNFGPTRFTANFVTKWEGHSNSYVRQRLESIAVVTPVRGKMGLALQSFYSSSRLASYGGGLAAAVYSFRPNLSAHAGLEHGFGPRSADLGVVWGVTYLYRGRSRPKP